VVVLSSRGYARYKTRGSNNGRVTREGAYNCVIAVRLSRPDTMRTAERLLPSFDIPDDRSRSPVRLRGQERPNICPRSVSLRWWSPLPADGGGEAGGDGRFIIPASARRGALHRAHRLGIGNPEICPGRPIVYPRPTLLSVPDAPAGTPCSTAPSPRRLGSALKPVLSDARGSNATFSPSRSRTCRAIRSRTPSPPPPSLSTRIPDRIPRAHAAGPPRRTTLRQLTAANAFLHFSWRE